MKKLLLIASAALAMAACSESSTAPSGPKLAPTNKASFDETLTCRSGYIVAYDENGNPYCKLDESTMSSSGSGAGGEPPTWP